jgi:hypothetical protein
MLEIENGSMDAAASPKPRRKVSHRRGQGVASQQAVQGLQGIIALGLQGASEVAASASDTPEVALLAGETERDPGEAEILALLPAQWMAKTAFGREVGKYLISDEHKAVALTLIAYLMRVAPPLYAKAKAADVARRKNTTPTRRSQVPAQPASAADQRGIIIPIARGFDPIIAGEPSAPGSWPATNGASPTGNTPSIPVPYLGR